MKGLNRKVEKKDVSEGTFPVDDTKKKCQLTKERRCKDQVIQKKLEGKRLLKKKMLKKIELEKEAKHEEDLTEAMILVNDSKKRRGTVF